MCAMNPRLLRPLATGFNPRSIAGLAGWWDATASTSLFNAVSGGSQSTADGSVMRWQDRSGNGNHLTQPANDSGKAPVRKVADANTDGKDAVLFDGSNDVLTLSSNINTSGGGSLFIVHKRTADANGGIHGFSGVADANHHPFSGTFYDGFATATRRSWTQAYSDSLQLYSVVSGTSWVAYINTAAVHTVASTTPAAQSADRPQGFGSGRYINNAAQDFHSGNYICEALLYNTALTTSQRQRVEGYLAWRWSLQGQLPTNHPYAYAFPGLGSQPQPSNSEAVDWISRVYANGGTVSTSTANAVNAFCNAIDAAGIRDRFYRLNLFAGTGLNAALVPLYRGPSSGGTQYGNTTDTNNGPFVSGDYSETGASGGLKGNGTSKYLDTGLPMNYPATNGDRHLAVYKTLSATSIDYSIGVVDSGAPSTLYQLVKIGNDYYYYSGGNANAINETDGTGLWVATGTVNRALYKDGVSVATNTNGSDTVNTATRPFWIFAQNSSGSLAGASDERQAAYSIGLSMTAGQVADYYTAMQAFQTALGRNV